MILRCSVFLIALLTSVYQAYGSESITPTITPSFFTQTDQITVSYDVTGTSLVSLGAAYIWVWIPGKGIDGKYDVNPATANQASAKFVRNGNVFSITFVPADFFTQDISAETSIGMLLKGTAFTNGQTTDYVINFWDGTFQIQLTSPSHVPIFVNTGDDIQIEAGTPVAADYELFVNDISINTQTNITAFAFTHSVVETSGYSVVMLVATAGANKDTLTFQYIVSVSSPTVARPPGIIPGINYDPIDDTKVTLCLWAPLKTSVYAVGDFNDWLITSDYIMNRDGEYFWIELNGITPSEENAFQYLVDEVLRVSDPYADKILDPKDQYIPSSTYPDLKPFPSQAVSNNDYENRVAVFQTGQTPYSWAVPDFVKPAKESLVVYELLIRDFFDEDHRNYQSLIDTISYFKRLGINAIELMPIMEFNDNEGWGYNPTFMFAPDKYYGTKNKLKEFVDVCHQNGIAVILDIAMNHQDIPNPYALMYFEFGADGTYGKPTANNPWFNRNATHPFNVFYDLNHESAYTKAYLDTVTHYWLNEFKVDGYRFDLSKGFTQKNTGGDVGAWGAYDATRISILERMADKIWSHTPDAIIILEHFADNSEEKVLAEYRTGEGKGMMLWTNMNSRYNQNTMGYASGSDIKDVYYKSRGWTTPHLVGYMESHDEERLMFKNLQYGNEAGNYNVKSEYTAFRRMLPAALIFYTIPGPKMIWQFGELGYDFSINTCSDGTINAPGNSDGPGDCRLSNKPLPWGERQDYYRDKIYEHTSDLLRLRWEYDVFTSGNAAFIDGSTLTKQITLRNNPYTATPADASEMNAQIVVNFDVTPQSVEVSVPHTGTWYDYYNYGLAIDVTATPFTMELKPGAFKLLTDVEITYPIITGIEKEKLPKISLYPNPVQTTFKIETDDTILDLKVRNLQGMTTQPVRLSVDTWEASGLASGLYIAEVITPNQKHNVKIIKID